MAVTYTLNDWFGAKVTAPGTGVLLNNEMDDFTAKPGVPNLYGLVQGQANAIAPGEAAAVVDEPDHRHQGRQAGDGGRHAGRQPHHHRGAEHDDQHDRLRHERAGAVDAPRFHQQWLPEPTNLEPFAERTRAASSRAWATSSPVRNWPTTWR